MGIRAFLTSIKMASNTRASKEMPHVASTNVGDQTFLLIGRKQSAKSPMKSIAMPHCVMVSNLSLSEMSDMAVAPTQ